MKLERYSSADWRNGKNHGWFVGVLTLDSDGKEQWYDDYVIHDDPFKAANVLGYRLFPEGLDPMSDGWYAESDDTGEAYGTASPE